MLAGRPVSPVRPQQRFLTLLVRAVVRIGRRQRQAQGVLKASQHERVRHELLPRCHRSEALIIEVIGYAFDADLIGGLLRALEGVLFQSAESDAKAVGPDVLRRVRGRYLTEVHQLHAMMS